MSPIVTNEPLCGEQECGLALQIRSRAITLYGEAPAKNQHATPQGIWRVSFVAIVVPSRRGAPGEVCNDALAGPSI